MGRRSWSRVDLCLGAFVGSFARFCGIWLDGFETKPGGKKEKAENKSKGDFSNDDVIYNFRYFTGRQNHLIGTYCIEISIIMVSHNFISSKILNMNLDKHSYKFFTVVAPL